MSTVPVRVVCRLGVPPQLWEDELLLYLSLEHLTLMLRGSLHGTRETSQSTPQYKLGKELRKTSTLLKVCTDYVMARIIHPSDRACHPPNVQHLYLVVVLGQTLIVRGDGGHELGTGKEEHLLKGLQLPLL